MRARIHIVLAAMLCLAACGTPGAPRPPSLRLPETVRDLVASRQGSTVTLTWTEPQRTTDGENLRTLGTTLVCMGINDFPMTHCDEVVADLSSRTYAQCSPKIGKPASCAVTLDRATQQANPRGMATYAIEVQNPSGRSAGLSNQVRVPTAYTAEPIPDVTASVTPDSVQIRFTGYGLTSYDYHVFRTEAGNIEYVDLGSAQKESPEDREARLPYVFNDRSFEWEKKYVYRVVAVTTVSLPDGTIVDVRGEPTPDVTVSTHDTFPPAAPSGLQAVASGVGQQPFVDMTWAPNTESDLAGYNVYRHEQGQPPVKINAEIVKTPSYRDKSVERSKTYFYSVSAVDMRGNESSKSTETSEVVH